MTNKEIIFETIKLLQSGVQKRKKCISTMQQHYNDYKARLNSYNNVVIGKDLFAISMLELIREYLREEMRNAYKCWQELNELQKQDTLLLKRAESNYNKEK